MGRRPRCQYLLKLTATAQRTRQRVEEARQGIDVRVTAVLDANDVAQFDRIAGYLTQCELTQCP